MKKIVIIKSVVVMILLAAIASLSIIAFRQPDYEVLNDCIEINSVTCINDIVKLNGKGKIVNGEDHINTSNTGEFAISFTIKNSFNKKSENQVNVKIVDTVAPVIECDSTLFIVKGEPISKVMEKVKVTDNSNHPTTYTISGDYNLNVPEKYEITINVSDESGNAASVTKDMIVEVEGDKAEYFTTSNGFAGYVKNGCTYIDGILIANKTYTVPKNYGDGLTAEFVNAFNKMKAAAKEDGLNIYVKSGYRSWTLQDALFKMYTETEGLASALASSAKPGHSEHQTGLAADLNLITEKFENTSEFAWLNENAYKYGFILRYTKDGEKETGYIYEPWHFRYVGVRLATIIYNEGNWLNLERYFGITSQYGD